MKILCLLVILIASVQTASAQTNYLATGNQYLNEGKYDKAERIFKEAINSDTSNLVYQCQLALSLLKQSRHSDAQQILDNVLRKDSVNVGALWYAGINNFSDKSVDLRVAIRYFEEALALLNESQPQYFSANWYIGRSYHILLQKQGINYRETSRLIECYSTYLRLQPDAADAESIREFTERVKRIRPSENVEIWVYRSE